MAKSRSPFKQRHISEEDIETYVNKHSLSYPVVLAIGQRAEIQHPHRSVMAKFHAKLTGTAGPDHPAFLSYDEAIASELFRDTGIHGYVLSHDEDIVAQLFNTQDSPHDYACGSTLLIRNVVRVYKSPAKFKIIRALSQECEWRNFCYDPALTEFLGLDPETPLLSGAVEFKPVKAYLPNVGKPIDFNVGFCRLHRDDWCGVQKEAYESGQIHVKDYPFEKFLRFLKIQDSRYGQDVMERLILRL